MTNQEGTRRYGYHHQYGFGIIQWGEDGSYGILFVDGIVRVIPEADVKILNEDFIDALRTRSTEMFAGTIRNRAREYVSLIRIDKVLSNAITASVQGTNKYRLGVSSSDGLRFACSCPYQYPCKHEYALYLKLEKIFAELGSFSIPGSMRKNEKTADLLEEETAALKKAIARYKEYDDMDANVIAVHLEVLKVFMRLGKDIKQAPQIFEILNESEFGIKHYGILQEMIVSYLQSISCTDPQVRKIGGRIFNGLQQIAPGQYSLPVYHRMIREGGYEMAFEQMSYTRVQSKNLPLFVYVYKQCKEKHLKDFFFSITGINDATEYLCRNLDVKDLLTASRLGWFFFSDDVPLEVLREMNVQEQMQQISLAKKSLYEDFQLEVYDDWAKNHAKSFASFILAMAKAGRLGTKLIDRLPTLPCGQILYDIVKNDSFSRDYDVCFAELEYYFLPSAEVTAAPDTYCLRVMQDCNLELFSYTQTLTGSSDDDIRYHSAYKVEYPFIKYVADRFFTGEIRKKFEAMREKYRQKEIKNQYAPILDAIGDYHRDFIGEIGEFREEKKCFFLPVLDPRVRSLRMKVGTGGFSYFVKNLREFKGWLTDEETIRFGNKLTVRMTPGNFKPPHDKLFSQLATTSIFEKTTTYSADECKVSPYELYAMLDTLRGEKILIVQGDRAEPFTIALDEAKIDVIIDADHVLHTVPAYTPLFAIANRLVLVDMEKKIVCQTPANKRLSAFYNAMLLMNGKSVQPIEKEFIDKVYSRERKRIIVDESLRQTFHVGTFSIRVYFDYENNVVTERHEFLLGDEKLDKLTIEQRETANGFDNILASLGFEKGKIDTEERILMFFKTDLTALKEIAEVFLSDSIARKTVEKTKVPQLRVGYGGDIFTATLEESAYDKEELKAVYNAIKKKKKYVVLKDRVIDLSGEESKEFIELMDDMRFDFERERSVLSFAQSLRALAHKQNVMIDDYLANLIGDLKGYKEKEYPLPDLHGELRSYQREGYRWLRIITEYNVGGVLADDMGLGKTIEIIALLTACKERLPVLIVCPKSLIFNWCSEFMRFVPDRKVVKIYGDADARAATIATIGEEDGTVYITSYDSLRNDVEQYQSKTFSFLIVDEAQYIKNVTAQKSLSVKSVKAAHKIALTGTPVENNLLDLWSIFDFIMPGFFDSVESFRHRIADEEYVEKLANMVAPFILRRTKEEVLTDLPEKFERIIETEMTEKQRKLYDAYRMQTVAALQKSKSKFDILGYLTRLRQICVAPELAYENYEGESGKLKVLEEIVTEYVQNKRKILIFSQFVKALDLVEKTLVVKGIASYRITGETPAEERVLLAEKFNEDDVPVFLISLKAGGTGLNLVGADTVIHLDPWWNVAAENQASDRAHRIGQTRTVEVIKLVSEGSVEEKVIELQNVKKELVNKVIASGDARLNTIGVEDILYMLQ